jgi:rhodanese-related sulfurtransferase
MKREAVVRRLTFNMNRSPLFQIVAIVVAAILVALCANAVASRDRRVSLTGSYPDALTVPPREVAPHPPKALPPVPAVATPTATVATAAPAPMTATTTTQPTATAAIETVGLNPAAKVPSAPMKTAPPSTAAEDPLKRFAVHPDKPYVEIAYADVKLLHAANVLFLDARRTSVYEQGHIPGARSYSVWESDIDDKVRKLFDERSDVADQARPIVIYCSGGDCEDSHMLAQKLWGIQFNNIYVYKDGFPDWQQHGAAVHTGATP